MRAWEAVDCPTCPAKTGQKCRTLTTSRVTDTHNLRLDRFREWLRRRAEQAS